MPIFNTKKKAQERSKALASRYNIKYSPDGESFTIHGKDDVTGAAGGSNEMVKAGSWLSSRKKRLTTRGFQKAAEAQNLEAIQKAASDEKAKFALLQTELNAEREKNAKLIVDASTGGTDKTKTKTKLKTKTKIAGETGPDVVAQDFSNMPSDLDMSTDLIDKTFNYLPNYLTDNHSKLNRKEKNTVWKPEIHKSGTVTNWEPDWAKHKKGLAPKDVKNLTDNQWSNIKDSNMPITYGMLKKAIDNKLQFIEFKGKVIDITKTADALEKFKAKSKASKNAPWYAPSLVDYEHSGSSENDLLPVVIEKTTYTPSLMDHLLSTGAMFKKQGGKLNSK